MRDASSMLREMFSDRSAQAWTVIGGVAALAALLVTLAQLLGGGQAGGGVAAGGTSAAPSTVTAIPSVSPSGSPSGSRPVTTAPPSQPTTPGPTARPGPETAFGLDEGDSRVPLPGKLRVALASWSAADAVKIVATDLQTRRSVRSDWLEVGEEIAVGRYHVQVTCVSGCERGAAEFVAYQS